MARSKFNIRQLDILSSSAAMADLLTSAQVTSEALDLDEALFIMQMSGSGNEMRPIKGSALHDYFSHIDVDTVSTSTEHTLLMIDPSDAQSDGDGFVIKYDSEGVTALSWTPDSNLLKTQGNLRMDSDSAEIQLGDDQEIVLKHVADTGLILSGTAGTEYLQFGASGVSVGSSADGQLDIDAGTTIQMQGGAFDLDGSSYDISGSSSMTMTMGGAYSLTGASTFDVDVDGALTLDGGSITIGGDSDVAVDIDAAALNIDASGEMAIAGQAGVLLHSTEAAADAIIIKASDASGGIDLIASGSDASVSGLSLDADSADFGTALVVNIDNTTQASSYSSGALVVDGGVGIAKNLYVQGNLVVQGDTTTLETTNMVVEDPIVQLGSASAGNVAADGDRGFVFSLTGSANRAFWWDNSASEFVLAPTTGSSSDTELNISGSEYASLRVGAFVAEGNVDLGNSDSDTVTFVADVDSDILPNIDTSLDLGATGAHWAQIWVKDLHSDDYLDLNGASEVRVESPVLRVSGSTADFYNLGAYANTDYASADGIMVRDASASTAKHMTFAELGQYLVRGTSETGTDSNGIQVNESTGVLSIDVVEQYAVRSDSASSAGLVFTLSDNYSSAILADSFELFLNGQLQIMDGKKSGYSDYSVSGTSVTMTEAIDTNDVVVIRYLKK